MVRVKLCRSGSEATAAVICLRMRDAAAVYLTAAVKKTQLISLSLISAHSGRVALMNEHALPATDTTRVCNIDIVYQLIAPVCFQVCAVIWTTPA